jgi:ABC-three component (ABC-3C) system Middle Component 6
MYLPNKGVDYDRALITVGAELLGLLHLPVSVSALWTTFSRQRAHQYGLGRVTFDWFALALAALFTLGLVDWTEDGYVRRINVSS